MNHRPKHRPTPTRATVRRRALLLRAVTRHNADAPLWRGAVALYTTMAKRWSDDTAKAVYPSQLRMAAEMGCCDRQVRRYLTLLVAAGFLTVLPGKRHPRPDGTWHRSNNLYLFRFPPKTKPPAPADRTPKSAHPLSERKNPPDIPAAVHPTPCVPANTPLPGPPPTPSSDPQPCRRPGDRAAVFAEMRQLLKPTAQFRR